MSEQNTTTALVEAPRKSITATMAARYDMDPTAFEATLRGTIMKPDKDGKAATREEFAAFLVVANEYNLNPLTKEIYAFFDRQRGGIIPIVGVDGWSRIINDNAQRLERRPGVHNDSPRNGVLRPAQPVGCSQCPPEHLRGQRQ